MINRQLDIQRLGANFDPTRTRQAVDDIRKYIELTPRFDTFGYSTTIVGAATALADTDLFSTTIPGGSLADAGDAIHFEASVTYAANANTKRVRLKFGATTLYDTGLLAINSGSLSIVGTLVRITATSTRFVLGTNSTSALLAGLSLTGSASDDVDDDQVFSLVGNNGTASDVSGWMWRLTYLPRP